MIINSSENRDDLMMMMMIMMIMMVVVTIIIGEGEHEAYGDDNHQKMNMMKIMSLHKPVNGQVGQD